MQLATFLHRYLAYRIVPQPLACARIALGCAALLAAIEMLGVAPWVLAPGVAVIPMAPGVPRPNLELLPLLIAIWFFLALQVTLGILAGPASLALGLLGSYFMLADQQFYSNHLYLVVVSLLWLSLGPADAAWSLRALRNPTPATVPGQSAILLRLQISAVYLFAAISKLNAGYLSGAVLAAQPRLLALVERAPVSPEQLLPALAAISILIEFGIVVCLWVPRLRVIGVLLGAALHGTIMATMGIDLDAIIGLSIFSLASMGSYALFFAEPRPASAVSEAPVLHRL